MANNRWGDDEIARFMEESIIPVRLSCIARSGYPLIVSLWFTYQEGRIYCATQRSARIVRHLEADRRCAFEVAGDQPPYRGVRGQGRAVVRADLGEKMLDRLIDRYLGDRRSALARSLIENRAEEIAIEIVPETLMTWDYTQRMRGAKVKEQSA